MPAHNWVNAPPPPPIEQPPPAPVVAEEEVDIVGGDMGMAEPAA